VVLEIYDLRRLPEDGDTIDAPLEAAWLADALNDGADVPLAIHATGRAHLDLARVGGQPHAPVVRVVGFAEAPLTTDCVRCQTTLELVSRAELDLTLFPAEAKSRADDKGKDAKAKDAKGKARGKAKGADPDDDGIELSAEQLDEGTYENMQVDLPSLVREGLLLELDMNPACTDEAACAERTKALLEAVNDDDPEPTIDPRWAALKRLVPSGDG
jgi:uncharacterized metal-binding protein YceD (DUF177 family)